MKKQDYKIMHEYHGCLVYWTDLKYLYVFEDMAVMATS